MPAVPAVSDEEFEPNDDVVDRQERGSQSIGHATDKADGRTDKDRGHHSGHKETLPAVVNGGFVAGNARKGSDKAKSGGDNGRRQHRRGYRTGGRRDVAEERHTPAA